MKKRYKIISSKHGVAVWYLRDYGSGYAWDDTGRRFRTKDEAQTFFEKEGDKNDSDRKSNRDSKETRRGTSREG